MSSINQSNLQFVSLYSGSGGFDLGFAQAGFQAIFANDIDRDATATHLELKNIRDPKWNYANAYLEKCITKTGDINNFIELIPKSPDLIIGGPPCQGFSVSGKLDPNDPRSKHVFKFIDIVNAKRPTAFIMENVESLAKNPRWESVLDKIMMESSKFYDVSLLVLNAAEWGVPQNRKRMFLIGYPKGTYLNELIFTPKQKSIKTVRQALKSLNDYQDDTDDWYCTAKITLAKRPVLRQSAYAGLMLNGSGRIIDIDQPSPTLPASMGGNRTPIIDLNHLEKNQNPWIEEYHKHLFVHNGKPLDSFPEHVRLRRISAREAAAIQSFPHGIKWQGPKSSVFRQIGNAVPPLLSYEIAKIIKLNIFEEKNEQQ